MNISEQKEQLRQTVKRLKANFSFEDKKAKSLSVLHKLEELKAFKDANIIMLYWSMKDEVQTHDFILSYWKKKKIILPSVKGDKLELKVFEGLDSMVPGQSFGILEPIGKEFSEFSKIDLIVVPGIAFDKQKNRLGRGKAYYDKLLKNSDATKAGICFDFQFFDEVPVDEYDIKMDVVLKSD